MQDFDVIVVGGGPAGATSALRCSQLGFKTALVEKGAEDRHKPCGGILPNICTNILNDLGLRVPREVMCSPSTVGLFYVPPSGKSNGGCVKNYRLLNVDRDRFDKWLRETAKNSGSEIFFDSDLEKFELDRDIKVTFRKDGKIVKVSTRYLVGADGTFSTVRRHLYPNIETEYLPILQERWLAEGDLGEYFYTIFNGQITNSYSYVIPKNGSFIVGTGAQRGYDVQVPDCIVRFKDWLHREFQFNPLRMERRDAWAIPYTSPLCGEGNVILVGDAAGFCNNLSGEGVRFAIESSLVACEAVVEAERKRKTLSSLYATNVQPLSEFIRRTNEFSTRMTDNAREEFVRTELSRVSFSTS